LDSDTERELFIQRECGSDSKMADFVRQYVASAEVETAPFRSLGSTPDEPFDRYLGSRIGLWTLKKVIGYGGFGVVFLAERGHPFQRAAIKLIHGPVWRREIQIRFQDEQQALAKLNHPNIVHLLDAGITAAHEAYVVMEYVEDAKSIDLYCRAAQLTSEQIVHLFQRVCTAVSYTHQKAIIHRDLKPSNILVAGDGTPKLLDFGLAKLMDPIDRGSERPHSSVAKIGTERYMSPEAIRGEDPTTATDVYGLCLVLYELLTGRPACPLPANASPPQVWDWVLQIDPDRPSKAAESGSTVGAIKRDLDAIVLKGLRKIPGDRYTDVSALNDDLSKLLGKKPVTARMGGAMYRTGRFVARNRFPTIGALTLTAVLLLGLLSILRQKRDTEARELMAWAGTSLNDDPERTLILGLHAWARNRAMPQGLTQFLHDGILTSRVEHTLRGPAVPMIGVAWTEQGSVVESESEGGTFLRWDPRSGRQLSRLNSRLPDGKARDWSPDHRQLAIGSDTGVVTVWDAATATAVYARQGPLGEINALQWSPDGTRLSIVNAEGTVVIWDALSGKVTLTIRPADGILHQVSWSPNGSYVAAASHDGKLSVWDATNGKKLFGVRAHPGALHVLKWLSDSRRVATAGGDRTVKVWELVTRRELVRLSGHRSGVTAMEWSPNENKVATASTDGTVRVWDARGGQELLVLRTHQGSVSGLAWSPDAKHLATSGFDGTARIWNVNRKVELFQMAGHQERVMTVAWSPDGRRIATASYDKTGKIWDAASRQLLKTLSGHSAILSEAKWSPDSTRVATGGFDNDARIWDASSGQVLKTLTGHQAWVAGVAWSPDGNNLATASGDKTIRVWDATNARLTHTLTGHQDWACGVAWSPDGKFLATASYDKTAAIWDSASGKLLRTMKGHQNTVFSVAWSPDGASIATASHDATARLWDAKTGREIRSLRGHEGYVHRIAWSPDGSMVSTASADGTVKVWLVRDGAELLTLRGHDGPVYGVAWSPDGKQLASVGDGIVQVYAMAEAELLRLVRSRITRDLTQRECRYYFGRSECPAIPDLP